MQDNREGAARLKQFIDEDRLLRGRWTGRDTRGRETACLLAAMVPEVERVAREEQFVHNPAEACPATLIPPWFAQLTPLIDDNCSSFSWHRIVRRYAALAARWHVLDAEAWRRLEVFALNLPGGGRTPEQAWLTAVRDAVMIRGRLEASEALIDSYCDRFFDAMESEIRHAEASTTTQDIEAIRAVSVPKLEEPSLPTKATPAILPQESTSTLKLG